jgi:rhamnulose-1-phosphate aldolase
MPLEPPYPTLDTLMTAIGEAGRRLAEIGASEGAAGNISLFIGWEIDPSRPFPHEEKIELPEPAPELAGKAFLVTGSGRRLREIADAPEANLGLVVINEGGVTGTLRTSPRRLFERLTVEFNSHLAVHRDQIARNGLDFHALIHAQPLHITYLSHVPAYQTPLYLNQHILRWQPESIMMLWDGVAYVPFIPPATNPLQAATVAAMRDHRVVLWAKHGVMARSDTSVMRACDLIEYAEVGSRYECLNLSTGEKSEGLTPAEIRDMCRVFGIKQDIF